MRDWAAQGGQAQRGSYNRVCAFIKRWRQDESGKPGSTYVPLSFALGEAFQFHWSTEYAFIGGLPLLTCQRFGTTAASYPSARQG